jgi:GT2 family glycosyltransferase
MTRLVRPRPPNVPRSPDLPDYLAYGVFEGLEPHPLFDSEYYARNRPDIAVALQDGSAGIAHYRSHGAAEGMDPHPLFDTRFYLRQCPDALRPGTDPLSHFLTSGWRDGFDPHPLFSVAFYFAHNPDVAQAGVNPLLHYLTAGQQEGRETSPFLDSTAYLRDHPEVGWSGRGPLIHYILHGAAMGWQASRLASFRIAHAPQYARPGGAIALAADDEDSYHAWIRAGRVMPAEWRRRAETQLAALRYRPCISVLLHVTADRADEVQATIRSVQNQVYADWQLCVVIDATVAKPAAERLDEAARQEPRLQLIRRGSGQEPAFALNTALDVAHGHFVSLLGAGDRLHPMALFALVGALQGDRSPALVYGDEDAITDAGLHVQPVFKPDWSPELLLGLDYVCRSSVIRTRLLRDLGGFRPGFDRASDYDMALRLLPSLEHQKVEHVAHPLYHRLLGTTPADIQTTEARNDGMHRALKAHTDARGAESTILRGGAAGRFQVAFEPKGEPLVSVVIPTGNARFAGPAGPEYVLENCIRSLRTATAWKALEIIVVHDGNLGRDQLALLEQYDVKLVPYDYPVFNFSMKVNMGVRASTGDYVLILNDDIEAKRPNWLRLLVGWLQQPGVGIVGPKLFFPDGRLQHTGIVVQHGNPGHMYYFADGNDPGYLDQNDTPRNWLAVTGACQLLRRSVFDAVGGYDESLPLNFNDVDFCMRILQTGLRVVYVPQAELYHFEGVTKLQEIGNQATTPYETDFFQARWRDKYKADPYYHPDLPPWEPLGLKKPDDIRRTPSQARKAAAPALTTLGVNWLGPVNRSSGLGTAARGYVAALHGVGVATRLVPLDKLFGHQALVKHDLTDTPQDFPISMVHGNADLTPFLFDHYGNELARARYRIGLWVWELPAARQEWVEAAKKYDEIWVPSTFNQTAFKAITTVPVTVVPYTLPELPPLGEADRAATRASLEIPDTAFVFLYMFDTFSFVDRKNPQVLLEAFEAEFGHDPDVILLLKISYFENLHTAYSADNQALLIKLEDVVARMPNVRIMTEILPQSDVYRLMNAVDCYVSPHRSEGFGLTVAEAMHYGRAVIATDFGGTTDFVREGVAFPLQYSLLELAADRGPYGKGNVWADPSVTHLRELMRTVASDPALCAEVGAAASAAVKAQFSKEAVGRLARRRLRSIAAGL